MLITQGLINQFADLCGDHNPIHIDPEYAATTIWGGTIAHGALVEALMSAEIARKFPGVIISYKHSLDFTQPVRPGDVVIVSTIKHAGETPQWRERVWAEISRVGEPMGWAVAGLYTLRLPRKR
jgi:acyl dehydratase